MEPSHNHSSWHPPTQGQQQNHKPQTVYTYPTSQSATSSNLHTTSALGSTTHTATNNSPLAPAQVLFQNAWQTAQVRVNNEISRLNNELADTKYHLSTSRNDCTRLRQQRNALFTERNQLADYAKRLTTHNDELLRENTAMRATGTKLLQDNRVLYAEIDKYRAAVERLGQESATLQKAGEVLQVKNAGLLDDNKRLFAELSVRRKEGASGQQQQMQEDWKTLWEEYKRVEDELQTRLTALNRMKSEWNLSRTVMMRIQAENRELKRSIGDRDSTPSDGPRGEHSTSDSAVSTRLREEHELRVAELLAEVQEEKDQRALAGRKLAAAERHLAIMNNAHALPPEDTDRAQPVDDSPPVLEPSVFCSEPLPKTSNQSERQEPTDEGDRPNKRPRLDKDSEIPPEPAIPQAVDVDKNSNCVKSEVNEDDLALTYPDQDETPGPVVIDTPHAGLPTDYTDKLYGLYNDRLVCRLCVHLHSQDKATEIVHFPHNTSWDQLVYHYEKSHSSTYEHYLSRQRAGLSGTAQAPITNV